MTKGLRYGLLGCGMMGQEHILNIQLSGAEVAAIVEPDSNMRARAAQLAPQAMQLSSVEQLIDSSELDALLIATPNYQHGEQLLQIFAKSKLPILVEKPLVTQIEQVKLIQQAASEHPAPVWVGMEYRFMPPLVNFREQLEAGAIGEMASLSIREHRFPFLKKVGNWNRFNRNSGGTLVEKCCHFFDLMRLLVADEPIRIMASAGQNCNHLDEVYQGESPDILDNAFVIVDFKSGRRAMLDLCMFAQGSRYEQEVCALGSTGKLECLIPGPELLWKEQQAAPRVVLSPNKPVGPIDAKIEIDAKVLAAGAHSGGTYYQHLGFQRAITHHTEVEVGIDDGLKAVVMGMAAQHSAVSGQAVNITDNGYNFSC